MCLRESSGLNGTWILGFSPEYDNGGGGSFFAVQANNKLSVDTKNPILRRIGIKFCICQKLWFTSICSIYLGTILGIGFFLAHIYRSSLPSRWRRKNCQKLEIFTTGIECGMNHTSIDID